MGTTTKVMSLPWKWEHGLKLEPRGHRIFRDARDPFKAPELRGWAIADNSGNRPDSTDDGVLWLDFSRPIVVAVGKYAGASLPVRKELDGARDGFRVSVGLVGLLTIRTHFRSWPVELSEDVKTLLTALTLEPAVKL
jgi:hypothetical protein